MAEGPVEGELFIRNYVRPDKKLPDSIRARKRAAYFLKEALGPNDAAFIKLVRMDLGLDYPYQIGGYNHQQFFEKCSLNDFLSAITLLIRASSSAAASLKACRNIFAEEQLRYRIDPKGGVHYLIDEAFELRVSSTIDGLGAPRFAAALQALNVGLNQLASANPSGKALIRSVFEALETVFLVLLDRPDVNRLNAQAIDNHLKPLVMGRHKEFPESEENVNRLLAILKSWVHAAHPYRHGANIEEIHEAPMDYATLMSDQGLSHIRFLACL